MYERNASVIDKYFGEKFGYRQTFNLKNNFTNYCDLLDKINELKDKRNAEKTASLEYNETCQKLKDIQEKHKKLSDKIAGNDYNRNILFSNINDDVAGLRKCFEKIEADIAKGQEEIDELSKEFCDCVADYQTKKATLEQIKTEREGIEQEYKAVFLKTKENYEKVNGDFVKYISKYTTEEIKKTKKELIDIITKNGAKEKIPFDTDVVSKAAEFATDVYKRIAEANVNIYDKTGKLIEEILGNSVKLSRHLKWRKDGVANIKFFDAEEQYLVQFLDNERIPVMHGAKIHRKLMLDACKAMVQDVEQMNNLYELILREIAGRSAKKAYKELYVVDYIENIEREERASKMDSTSIELATVINSNYWRIEGMRNVYNTFDSIVTELYEKDLDDIFPKAKKEEVVQEEEDDSIDEIEFELPKAKTIDKLTDTDDSEDQIVNAVENLTEEVDEGQPVEEFETEAAEEEVGVAKFNELDESIGDIFAEDEEEAINIKVEDKKKKAGNDSAEKKSSITPKKVTAKKVSKKEEIEAILGDDDSDKKTEAQEKKKSEKAVKETIEPKEEVEAEKEESKVKVEKAVVEKKVTADVDKEKSAQAKKAFKEIKAEEPEEEDEDIQKVIDLKYAKLADEIDMLDEEDDVEIENPIKATKKSTPKKASASASTAKEVFQMIDATQSSPNDLEDDDLLFAKKEDYSADSLFTSINDAKKTQEDLYEALNQINSKPKKKKKGFLGLF